MYDLCHAFFVVFFKIINRGKNLSNDFFSPLKLESSVPQSADKNKIGHPLVLSYITLFLQVFRLQQHSVVY